MLMKRLIEVLITDLVELYEVSVLLNKSHMLLLTQFNRLVLNDVERFRFIWHSQHIAVP